MRSFCRGEGCEGVSKSSNLMILKDPLGEIRIPKTFPERGGLEKEAGAAGKHPKPTKSSETRGFCPGEKKAESCTERHHTEKGHGDQQPKGCIKRTT